MDRRAGGAIARESCRFLEFARRVTTRRVSICRHQPKRTVLRVPRRAPARYAAAVCAAGERSASEAPGRRGLVVTARSGAVTLEPPDGDWRARGCLQFAFLSNSQARFARCTLYLLVRMGRDIFAGQRKSVRLGTVRLAVSWPTMLRTVATTKGWLLAWMACAQEEGRECKERYGQSYRIGARIAARCFSRSPSRLPDWRLAQGPSRPSTWLRRASPIRSGSPSRMAPISRRRISA